MSSPAAVPDVIEAGRTAAQLSDWQTITYFLMFIIVILIIERAWAGASMRKERERMWSVSEKFGNSAEKLGQQLNTVVTELEVQRALNARSETALATLEARVAELLKVQP